MGFEARRVEPREEKHRTSRRRNNRLGARGNEQINGAALTPRLNPRCNLQTEMRERVLAFVRAIVKSAHLNMNKSCAQSVCSAVRPFARTYVRSSVCPFIRPTKRRRRRRRRLLAYIRSLVLRLRQSVLHMCIYGLLNGDRLQIRRAVNQASNGPHGARTIREAKRWVLLLRPVWLIKYWVHRLDGTPRRVFDDDYDDYDENVVRDGDSISPVLGDSSAP